MYLLDVNALIALAWDDHVHFAAAQNWFSANAARGFATCHVTQSGFLRLSLNPSVVHCQISATTAIAKLVSLTSQPGHQFWEDGPVETTAALWASVRTTYHVTDTNLVLIAKRNGGKLVTFDRTIRSRLTPDIQSWVELIEF